MGTRSLTMVIDKSGETKVAQYGQWDGYPDYLGVNILRFLKDKDLFNKFVSRLSVVRFLDEEGKDKEFVDSYNKKTPQWSNEPDNRTDEQKRWWSLFQSRDLSHRVLENIANSSDEEVVLNNSEYFAKDSLMCEWAYVIDLSTNSFEVYKGFNQSPLSEAERFYSKEPKREYYPVRLAKEYSLSDLPDEDKFLEDFKDEEE